MRAPIALFLALTLTACADFPELDATVTSEMKAADYPALAPTSELTASQAAPRLTETSASELTGRVASLRARAYRLRGSIVSSADKARMQAGVSEPVEAGE
ncbi:hypothetical protein [Lentibacter sp. XHP0401]|uniref:hypothetical protein n=1 Tax=Lentibacter sp. XHP0401 TaxID=2984334 RepID=UPI0021E7C56A|nr:hypothetical protein [Lentibacter sp. XHP0401]MCV2894460.1 hypothetical protein [Lentibacter sp. XHP0401]